MNSLYEKIKKSPAAKTALTILSFVPAVAALAIVLYYIWGPAEGYLHSDFTDTILWANASVESGKVFDETYRYAGLLPFSSALWMIPLIKIFGLTMLSQNIGMSIFALLLAFGIWFCCRSAKLGYGWSGAAVFIVMMVASTSVKLQEIMWGHTIYYSMSIFLLCYCAAFALRAIDSLRNKKYVAAGIWLVLLCVMCAGAATDGAQVLVIGSLPVIAGIFAERIFCGRDKLFSARSCASWAAILAAAVGTVIGLVLLAKWKAGGIDSGYADAYSGWSAIENWAANAQLFVKQWFTLLGVTVSKEGLFSKDSIPAIMRIACGVIILVIPVVMLVFYKKLSSDGVKTVLWGHFVISAAVMFGFICGKLSGANWRLTPIVCSSTLCSVMGVRELCAAGKAKRAEADAIPAEAAEKADKKQKKEASSRVLVRFGALITAVLCAFSCVVFAEIKKMPADYGRDNYNHVNAAFIESKGLEYGYATFWYSQAITLISDSHVKCREILAPKGGIYSDFYQSSRRWYTGLDYDRYFILLSSGEYSTVSGSASWNEWVGNYLIESYTDADGLYPGFRLFVFDRNILDIGG